MILFNKFTHARRETHTGTHGRHAHCTFFTDIALPGNLDALTLKLRLDGLYFVLSLQLCGAQVDLFSLECHHAMLEGGNALIPCR